MPRLVPRLLQRLQASNLKSPPPVVPQREPRHKSYQRQPKPPPPCPPLAPQGRTQSIILDSLGPIMAISRSRRHKEPNPCLRMIRKKRRKHSAHQDQASLREMTEEERELWASPYLRMLSTPLRMSAVGLRHLPSAFLIRFSAKRVYGPKGSTVVIVPDTIEHPAFRRTRRPGFAQTIICRREALAVMRQKETYRRIHATAKAHPKLEEQVDRLLRVRALQELHILVERLRRRPGGATDAPLLRRLTRAEWKVLKESGTIPQEDAVAILVVPPLNRNPTTRARPEPSMSSLPPSCVEEVGKDGRPLPPVSTLIPTSSNGFETDKLSITLPQSKVPLYNGLALFPSSEQRAACHKMLAELLHIERRARLRERIRQELTTEKAQSTSKAAERARGDEKGSHAFLLRSNAKTLLRADTVPLAIALWRIRLWEGQGWELGGSPEYIGPWAAN